MTPAEMQTLKAAIVADPVLNAWPNNSDGNTEIQTALSLNAVPDYWVYRTAVSKAELVQSTSVDGTTFNWTGAGFITRSVGERDAWREIFSADGLCNPSLPSVRQAFQDIFSGTGVAAANRTHLATISRRKCTRFEQLYTAGPGNGTAATPANLVIEGQVSVQDINTARNLP